MKVLLPILAVIAMATAGWNLGGNSREKPAAELAPTAIRARPERPVRKRPGPSGEAAQRLAAIRAAANPSERMRATIDLANSLSPADFAAWLGGSWFTPRGGMEATVFKQILLERWRQEDTEGHLLWCRENDPGAAETLFMTWAEAEPQRLLDFFEGHPNDRDELAWLGQIAEKHPDLALRRLQEMAVAGISSDDFSQAESLIAELAKQSPASLEATLDALPAPLKFKAVASLMREELEASFASGLRKLIDRPDGLDLFSEIFESSSSLGEKLIDELSNLPAAWRDRIVLKAFIVLNTETAAKWAALDLEASGFTAQQATAIRFQAVEGLQYRDPEAALKLLAELDLPEEKKQKMLTSLFGYVSDPEKTESLLALLGSDEERQIARDALPQPSPPKPEIPKIEQPAEWLAAVVALGLNHDNLSSYTEMTQSWEPEQIAALAAGFRALPEAKKRDVTQLFLQNGLGESLPLRGEVITFLVTQPPDWISKPVNFATDYAVELGKENPEKAGGWIEALPDGDAKWYAAKNLQSVWSLYDPEAAERWLKSLPAATREKVEELK